RPRQPQRLERPEEPANLPPISHPPRVIRSCAGPIVTLEHRLPHHLYQDIIQQRVQETAISRKGDFRPMLLPPLHVPPVSRWDAADDHTPLRRACAGRTCHPVEKWLPDLSRLLSVQSLGDHVDDERVVGVDVRLLTPMVVEEMLAVEA